MRLLKRLFLYPSVVPGSFSSFLTFLAVAAEGILQYFVPTVEFASGRPVAKSTPAF